MTSASITDPNPRELLGIPEIQPKSEAEKSDSVVGLALLGIVSWLYEKNFINGEATQLADPEISRPSEQIGFVHKCFSILNPSPGFFVVNTQILVPRISADWSSFTLSTVSGPTESADLTVSDKNPIVTFFDTIITPRTSSWDKYTDIIQKLISMTFNQRSLGIKDRTSKPFATDYANIFGNPLGSATKN